MTNVTYIFILNHENSFCVKIENLRVTLLKAYIRVFVHEHVLEKVTRVVLKYKYSPM